MTRLGSFVRDYLTPLLVLVVAGVVAYDHLVPHDGGGETVVNGRLLGRQFAKVIAASFGDAWQTAAATLEAGKPMAEAQASLQTKWQNGRSQAFATQVAPEFSKVLAEGVEPTDPTQRAAVVKLWRDFATGLRGGR